MIQSNPIIQLKAKPNSDKAAIKAMCAYCVGCTPDHMERGFRKTIRECSAYECPLRDSRPFQKVIVSDKKDPNSMKEGIPLASASKPANKSLSVAKRATYEYSNDHGEVS